MIKQGYFFVSLASFAVVLYVWTRLVSWKQRDRIHNSALILTTILGLFTLGLTVLTGLPPSAGKYVLARTAVAVNLFLGFGFLYSVMVWTKVRFKALLILLVALLIPAFLTTVFTSMVLLPSPPGADGLNPGPLFMAFNFLFIGLPVAVATAVLLVAFLRSRESIGRGQLKLLLTGTSVLHALALAGMFLIHRGILSDPNSFLLIAVAAPGFALLFFAAVRRYDLLIMNLFRNSRVLFNSIGEGVLLLDAELNVVEMNDTARRLLSPGRRNSTVPVSEVLPGYTPSARPRDYLLGTGASARRLEVSESIRSTDRREEHGRILIIRDMTERMRLLDEVQRKQKLESIGLLAGGIAHDFNNLLTTIATSVSLAYSVCATNEEARTHLENAEKAILRSEELTGQLLTFSKGGHPVKQDVHLEEIASGMWNLFDRKTGVKLERAVAPHLPPVTADPAQIQQVLNNLFLNASQAMPSGGTIRLELGPVTLQADQSPPLPAGDYVRLSVSDTGTGIPPENLPHIFDPYFTTKSGGTGLGLAIVHSIIARHDGRISVESASGQGTRFEILLPAAVTAREPASAPPAFRTAAKREILVMEDDPLLREVVEKLLLSFECSVSVCAKGEEALALVKRRLAEGRPYDLFLFDLVIKDGKGGVETIGEVRRLHPDIPAVVMSGYSDDPVMSRFQEYGFSAALRKPFTADLLRKTIEELAAPAPGD